MIKAGVISIGTEILSGKIVDTNSQYIIKFLSDFNITTSAIATADDTIDSITSTLKFIVGKSDLIVITGGLGPTTDDLTLSALSHFLSEELIFDEKQWKHIKNLFIYRNIPVYESNKKQAYKLKNSEFISNNKGSAPGIYIQKNNKTFILLPGPPHENQPMLTEWVYKKLKLDNIINGAIFKKILYVYASGESQITDILKEQTFSLLSFGCYFVQNKYIELHFTKQLTDDTLIDQCNVEYEKSKGLLQKNNIFFTENEELSQLVLKLLTNRRLTVSFAESVTGGGLSAELVKYPGASNVLVGDIVAYSNDLKQNALNVSSNTLKNFGAVSEQTAIEMAKGLNNLTHSDISISVTGIAGPCGAVPGKPVGLVYFGFIFGSDSYVEKTTFRGDRMRIIAKITNYVYMKIYKHLTSSNLE